MSIIRDVRLKPIHQLDYYKLTKGEHALALIFEKDDGAVYAHYCVLLTPVSNEKLDDQGTNLCDTLLSPSILKELRTTIESYLVSCEGHVHLKRMLLCDVADPEAEDVKDMVGGAFYEIATFTDDQWQSKPLGVEDIRFDILEYSRMTTAGTSWEVTKVHDDGSFTIVEVTGGSSKYSFRINNIFDPGFTPKVGAELTISHRGDFYWGADRKIAQTMAKTSPTPGGTRPQIEFTHEEDILCQIQRKEGLHEELPTRQPERSKTGWLKRLLNSVGISVKVQMSVGPNATPSPTSSRTSTPVNESLSSLGVTQNSK